MLIKLNLRRLSLPSIFSLVINYGYILGWSPYTFSSTSNTVLYNSSVWRKCINIVFTGVAVFYTCFLLFGVFSVFSQSDGFTPLKVYILLGFFTMLPYPFFHLFSTLYTYGTLQHFINALLKIKSMSTIGLSVGKFS